MDIFPDDLRRRWAIRGATLIADTRSSLVYRVERLASPSAIVKLLKPAGMNELPGMAFLEWRQGSGAVHLIDRHGHACLMEDAGREILRDHYRQFGDRHATDILLEVLGKLHAKSPVAPPDGLVPLRTHFNALFEKARCQADPALADVLPWAAALADELLDQQIEVGPLHGDLHHDNIVTGGLRGWLAIDPQGLIGDRAYDVANVFGNPLGGTNDILNPSRIRTLATRFSLAVGCSETRILRFAAAHAGLSICWSLDQGGSADAQQNIAERLAFAHIARRMLEESRPGSDGSVADL
jgi:streptomycin 6-kinase